MAIKQKHLDKLQGGYLFPEIKKRITPYQLENPHVNLINLGVGDTTRPLAPAVVTALVEEAQALGTTEGYTGYGPFQGIAELRESIAGTFYKKTITADDIFISDGIKPDMGRLQLLFGETTSVAIQDPSYPVYVDTTVITGKTQSYDKNRQQYGGIHYMTCSKENGFFPNIENLPNVDLIFICSPNNPTGAAATYEQLKRLVDFAQESGAIIIFDAAYAPYIQDPTLPRTIYDIPGAETCAIEFGSFSKMAGFTGLRLGWSVVPEAVAFRNGDAVKPCWQRIVSTFFNGASSLIQKGGVAALSTEGYGQIQKDIAYYLDNAKVLSDLFQEKGFEYYGGENAPFVWVRFPEKNSWDVFDTLLKKANVIATPGIGFGPAGEGYVRFSAFGDRSTIVTATERLSTIF